MGCRRRTGGTPPPRPRTSPSPKRRASWDARSRRWQRIRIEPGGTGQSLSSGGLAKVYGFTDLDGSQPDCWRYLTEVQEAGKPADVTGYR